MKTIRAIYDGGVFRPTEPVDLPEGCMVTVEPKPDAMPPELSAGQRHIHELLGQGTDTSDPFLSARHNEHQP